MSIEAFELQDKYQVVLEDVLKPCSSCREGQLTCKDGFFQEYFCRTGKGISESNLPHCLKDEIPEHWIKEDGNIKFYKGE